MRTRLLLAALLPIALLTACGSGDAARSAPSIRPGESIAGVRLGMAEARVRRVLGEPDQVRPSGLHGGWETYVYRGRRLHVTIADRARVWDVRTLSPADRTAGGVGVGSTEAEVREDLPRLRCRPYGGPRRYRTWRVCADDAPQLRPFTQFTLIRGRVAAVTVARGLAV